MQQTTVVLAVPEALLLEVQTLYLTEGVWNIIDVHKYFKIMVIIQPAATSYLQCW